MAEICVKLKNQDGEKYRKMLSLEENIYGDFDIKNVSTTPYMPDTVLDDGEWFCINKASQKEYAIDLLKENYSTVDFGALEQSDSGNIDYLFLLMGNIIFFQKVPKLRIVSKKMILCFGDEYKYQDNFEGISIKEYPDAFYNKDDDTLYFRKLESITSIFNGIDQLYKEATQQETESFLKNNFISLKNKFSADKVKKANRKRIALAQKILQELNEDDKKQIFNYIGDYCPDLKTTDDSFEIREENELKLLLYGIEQRFYTTPVGKEKWIANSVIPFIQGGKNNGQT